MNLEDNPDILAFKEKAIGMQMGISESTISKYMSNLLWIKNICGLKDLSEFHSQGPDKMEAHWSKIIVALKGRNATLNYANLIISALTKYLKVSKVPAPTYIVRQNKNTYKQTEKSHDRKVRKEELVDFILNHFPKIYSADLTDYSDDPFMQERGRFLVIHMFFCGLRRSEARIARIDDEINKGEYHAILVKSPKTKKIFEREIKERRYWEARETYLRLLKKKYGSGEEIPFLFPNMFGGGMMSNERISQIISGYYDNANNWKKGVAESVWDKVMFTHIFRHARTNDLLRYMPVDVVKEWRQDESMDTTMAYVDGQQQKERISEYLKDKPVDDWREAKVTSATAAKPVKASPSEAIKPLQHIKEQDGKVKAKPKKEK